MFKGGEPVRAPNPEGDGTVKAVYITPSEPSRRHAEYVWVQYAEGPQKGVHARVRYSEIKPD
jgi:hypothetical protein